MQGMSLVLSSLGLSRNPFPPTPDASSYFFTAHLQTQFSEVQHCIEARKGFVLVTGEVGLGKSTLVRRLLRALPVDQTVSALILNTFLQEADLLAAILRVSNHRAVSMRICRNSTLFCWRSTRKAGHAC